MLLLVWCLVGEVKALASPSGLLYQDQQAAMARRAFEEEGMMAANSKELKAPLLKKTKAKAGTGFGSRAVDSGKGQEARVLRKEGVLRVDRAVTSECADALRTYLLEEQRQAYERVAKSPELARSLFGVEDIRKNRCDLQLSLLRNTSEKHQVADVLQELLGEEGSLRSIYEDLVTTAGEFYELAAVITNPGSDRQQVHPDLPFRSEAPLYVLFLALQDITEAMGPTSFLPRTHTAKAIELFDNPQTKDDLLRTSKCLLSTLNKGDAVIFDARLLHCGNANKSDQVRALFNLSFRNPKVTGDLGYEGSMRPNYVQRMNLADVANSLKDYTDGNLDPYAHYGDGLLEQ